MAKRSLEICCNIGLDRERKDKASLQGIMELESERLVMGNRNKMTK